MTPAKTSSSVNNASKKSAAAALVFEGCWGGRSSGRSPGGRARRGDRWRTANSEVPGECRPVTRSCASSPVRRGIRRTPPPRATPAGALAATESPQEALPEASALVSGTAAKIQQPREKRILSANRRKLFPTNAFPKLRRRCELQQERSLATDCSTEKRKTRSHSAVGDRRYAVCMRKTREMSARGKVQRLKVLQVQRRFAGEEAKQRRLRREEGSAQTPLSTDPFLALEEGVGWVDESGARWLLCSGAAEDPGCGKAEAGDSQVEEAALERRRPTPRTPTKTTEKRGSNDDNTTTTTQRRASWLSSPRAAAPAERRSLPKKKRKKEGNANSFASNRRKAPPLERFSNDPGCSLRTTPCASPERERES